MSALLVSSAGAGIEYYAGKVNLDSAAAEEGVRPALRVQLVHTPAEAARLLRPAEDPAGCDNRKALDRVQKLDFVLIAGYVGLLASIAYIASPGGTGPALRFMGLLLGWSTAAFVGAAAFFDVVENLQVLELLTSPPAHTRVRFFALLKWACFFAAAALTATRVLLERRRRIPYIATGAFIGTIGLTAGAYGLWAVYMQSAVAIQHGALLVIAAIALMFVWAWPAAYASRRISSSAGM